MWKSTLTLALAAALLAATAAVSVAQEAELIAVLKSDAAQKEKADACRELAHVGTKQAVPTLAALLGDEKLVAHGPLRPGDHPRPVRGRRPPRRPGQAQGPARCWA